MMGMTVVNDRIGAWPGSRDREEGGSGVQARDAAMGLVELALLQAHVASLARGSGVPIDVSRLDRGVYGMLMMALGNVMPKLPRNGLIGIRTPWTLADPSVWERTHRLAGYLVSGAGLVSLASLPAASKRAARLPFAAILGAVVVSAAYSYITYARRDRFGP
jgi:uncharacterized membrane protein